VHTNFVHDPYRPDAAHAKEFAGAFKPKRRQTYDKLVKTDFERETYFAQFDLKKPSEREHLKALYDAGIRSFDERFRRFLGILKEHGLYENSIIILTSDHGEAFGDHGHFLHEMPYRDELHTPLVIRGPGVSPKRVKELSLGADIVPTVLELVGLPRPADLDGRSLVPLMNGERLARDKFYFAAGYRSEAIADGEWKLLVKEASPPELYQTSADQEEKKDVSKQYPEEASRLEAELEKFKLSRRKNLVYQNPLTRNKKLYWFIPDGMRADRGDFNIFRWAREGKLPNIKRMMENGAYGYSIPYFPSHTPINFASLLTGTPPSTHGISDGPMHVEGAPLARPSAAGFSSTARKVPAIWKTLEDAGKNVFLLSVPGSTPP
jgi:arylsulfatase A-like enzyme